MKKELMVEAIDWNKTLAAPRYAGGHEDVMRAIFGDRATVIAEWREDDYQGQVAFAYEFADGGFCVMTDYFGSCSGCDSWEGATDAAARNMVTELVSSARFFETLAECEVYCADVKQDAVDYGMRPAENLVVQLGARRAKEVK